jgi:acetyl-CoA acetyltransferase
MGLGGRVAIVGSGVIKYGENFHQSLTDMIDEAVSLALADAGLERTRLQAAWLGCYEPMLYGFEGNSGAYTSGGLKSCGHPIGSSGVRMIANIHDQLLGRAGRMQVKGARVGLAHNLGGPGAVSAVAVLGQP